MRRGENQKDAKGLLSLGDLLAHTAPPPKHTPHTQRLQRVRFRQKKKKKVSKPSECRVTDRRGLCGLFMGLRMAAGGEIEALSKKELPQGLCTWAGAVLVLSTLVEPLFFGGGGVDDTWW